MSRADRLSRILGKAAHRPAPEPVKPVALPENVLELPVRSAWLKNTEQGLPKPEGINRESLIGIALLAGPYVAAVTLALTLIVIAAMWRQTLVYSDVGRSTCSTLNAMDDPENQIYWLAEDPGYRVPALKAKQVAACADAARLF